VIVEAWNLDRFHDGQLTESRVLMDVMGLLTQLGAMPGPRRELTDTTNPTSADTRTTVQTEEVLL
jgi:hypothetical protein